MERSASSAVQPLSNYELLGMKATGLSSNPQSMNYGSVSLRGGSSMKRGSMDGPKGVFFLDSLCHR
jgi:hypothetical protein